MPKHGIGEKIKQHYVSKHTINEGRPELFDYLSELIKVRESDCLARFCFRTDEAYVSKKQLALHHSLMAVTSK